MVLMALYQALLIFTTLELTKIGKDKIIDERMDIDDISFYLSIQLACILFCIDKK